MNKRGFDNGLIPEYLYYDSNTYRINLSTPMLALMYIIRERAEQYSTRDFRRFKIEVRF